MSDTAFTAGSRCLVAAGWFREPYTGRLIPFRRGAGSSKDVQVDHVVALGDAWQKGAQQLTAGQREHLANDPLNLIAADGPANQDKSASDAATWLPFCVAMFFGAIVGPRWLLESLQPGAFLEPQDRLEWADI